MDTVTATRSFSISKELKGLKEAVLKAGEAEAEFDPEKYIDAHLPVRVNEQRVSNLSLSALVAMSVFAILAIKWIPTSVLQGYFAYMAIDSLPGNLFWERITMLFVAPSRRYKILEEDHASFVESVPFKSITSFTLDQLVYLLICYGVTWIPIAGILYLLPFFLLILIRQHLLPKFFEREHLQELDAVEYVEIVATPYRSLSLSLKNIKPSILEGEDSEDGGAEFYNAEVMDEMMTNRGEVKLRTVSLKEEMLYQVSKQNILYNNFFSFLPP